MTGDRGFQIGMALPGDWGRLENLQELCFPGDPTQVGEIEFHHLAEGQGGNVLVARSGAYIAGYIVMRRRGLLPWENVAFMAVDPRYRGCGLGTLLTKTALSCAQRPFLRLCVRPSNDAALAIYRKLGFRVIGKRDSNYDDGEDALIMMCWNGFPLSRPPAPAGAAEDVAA